jgi:tetratricopeptide (TPR) repeat protein
MSSTQKSRQITFGILLVVLLGIMLYSNILFAPFVYDDHIAIVENESIRSLSASMKLFSNNRYLPMQTFALNYSIGGLKPFGYHLINNILHVCNALLVFYLIILTWNTPFFRASNNSLNDSRIFAAFSAAFVFVAHPIQTQAVSYVVQRSTLMATLFYLLCLVLYIKSRLYIESYKSKSALSVNFKSAVMYLMALVSALFAMKSKEIAFTLPIIVAIYEFSFFNGEQNVQFSTSKWKRILYVLPIALTMLIIPLSFVDTKGSVETIVQNVDMSSRETINFSRAEYLLTQFRVIITYIRLLLLPVQQNFDYTYPVYHSFFAPQIFFSFLCLAAILGTAVYLICRSRSEARNLRLFAFGIIWFFVALSVESSIIPIRDMIVEHRLYLPSIGFFMASALAVSYFIKNSKVKVSVIVIIVALLSVGTYARNIIWKSPQTLWEDVLIKSPGNSRAYNNLGVVFKDRGEFDKAIEQFEKSLKADRNYTSVYFNLGDVQYRLGNYENAVSYLTTALAGRLDTQLHLDILNKLGRTYSAMGQNEKAIQTFQRAIQVMPSAIAPYNNLAVQYIKTGQFDLAIEILKKALEIREEPYLLSNLNIAYSKKIRILKHL